MPGTLGIFFATLKCPSVDSFSIVDWNDYVRACVSVFVYVFRRERDGEEGEGGGGVMLAFKLCFSQAQPSVVCIVNL